MIRLKMIRFVASVPPPGQVANSHEALSQWNASDDVEIQAEGPWVAIFTSRSKVPRLVPMVAVLFAEPLEPMKGFEAPDFEARRKAKAEAAKPKAVA
jgi:hypothetical protein